VEEPRKIEDEITLRAQWKLLELRRDRGIPISIEDLQRTRELERRVLAMQHKTAA
jgi:hypothetical protein